MNLSSGYHNSVFQDFETYLRTEIDLVEHDVRLVLHNYESSFFTYELQPGIYTFKDLSEALYSNLQPEYPVSSKEIVVEFDNITRKTQLVVRPGIIAEKFDKKSFFSTVLDFTAEWDYKHYNEYISQKIVNLSNTNIIHLNCDVIGGSIQDGIRQRVLFSFVLDKMPGYKMFCEPQTIRIEK